MAQDRIAEAIARQQREAARQAKQAKPDTSRIDKSVKTRGGSG